MRAFGGIACSRRAFGGIACSRHAFGAETTIDPSTPVALLPALKMIFFATQNF
jgi:hypothetical protein